MVTSINSTLAATLFSSTALSSNSSTTTNFTDPVGIDADLLVQWASAKAGITGATNTTDAGADPKAPIEPVWTPGISPDDATLVTRAISGKAFFDTSAKLYSDLNATGDYKKLFALYSGLTTLEALSKRASDTTLSTSQVTQNTAAFNRGLTELSSFFDTTSFDDIRLAQGDRVDSAQTTLSIPTTSQDYITGVIHKGSLAATVSGLDPNAKFTIVDTSSSGNAHNVSIDLSQMGTQTRSLGNVVSFINSKLSAAGVASRLATVDQTPKTTTLVIGGKPTNVAYTGSKMYALKVDVSGGERVSFQPVSAAPAFYAVGDVAGGSRLIKLQDTSGAAGQPVNLDRPAATQNATGPDILAGWLATQGGAQEQRSSSLVSDGANNFETALRAPGEAVLNLTLADGRKISVSTAWKDDDFEAWRARAGETQDQAIVGDLAERLNQLLHEQGVAAGFNTWTDGAEAGVSLVSGDQVRGATLTIGGRDVPFSTVDDNLDVGLRDGVFAREFSTAAGATGDLFKGDQTFTFVSTTGSQTITIDGGTDGVDAQTIADRLNDKIKDAGIDAAASITDDGGTLHLRVDGYHDLTSVSASINGANTTSLDLEPPGAWANGGLPVANAGEPYADAVRTYTVAGDSPLQTYTGALAIQLVVATPTGNKTVNVSVSAAERANDPDNGGQLSSTFQQRLDAALNSAGVYVGTQGNDLSTWQVAEDTGQRILSLTINGDAQTVSAQTPAYGLGGALSAERSFSSAQASTGVADTVAALQSNQSVSISFSTAWGNQTISAALQPGDPPTLQSAALRLNEALASAGYDLGVEAVDFGGGSAGLRVITGDSHTIRTVSGISLGGQTSAITLDPIDALTHASDPPGALSAADRAARGASAIETVPATSPFTAPSNNPGAWFAGRAFDVQVGANASIATARAVAAAADGSVYVLADLGGDSTSTAIKGSRDVALIKFDSAGKQIFSEVLGSSSSASGFALAVSGDGKVAVAGSVTGALAGTQAKGGADSFVAEYDANGKELWTARRGATGDDQASAIAFAPDGSIVVAGKTNTALPLSTALGGADGYVRGYSSAGAELFTRQFGTGGDDAATALAVRSDGAGGYDIYTGGVESNRGVVRSFNYAPGSGFSATATRDIGYFLNGSVNALAVDGSSLYVGGAVGADRLTVGNVARAAVAGSDGFVTRVDTDLTANDLDRTTYIGSSQSDAVKGLSIVNGDVYAAGTTSGVLDGQGHANIPSAFLTRLDDSGDMGWTQMFRAATGTFTLNSVAADANASSPLDVLGLPKGQVATSDSGLLTARTALRAGDAFKIGSDTSLSTISVQASDTLSSLTARISLALGSNGHAAIVHDNGVDRVQITANDGKAVRIGAGPDGKDALGALGLKPGVIAANPNTDAAVGSLKTFGLGVINADLRLDSKTAITNAQAEISAAISIVRQAYDALLHPNAKPETDEEKALDAKRIAAQSAPAPAYLTAQLQNYQAALARLTGGS